MVLVTLGTQKEPFTRLLDAIENSNIKDRIVVQAGHTKYESSKMEIFDFIDYDKMSKLEDEADYIITHAGTGSVVEPLKKKKKIIVCARLEEYSEHVDNHQLELVKVFKDAGFVLELKDKENLDDVIAKLKDFTPNEYHSNTENFKNKLRERINSYLKGEFNE